MMRRCWALALLLLCLGGLAQAQGFDDYLKLRKHYHITQPAGVGALDAFIGKRIVEVRGVVKGFVGSQSSKMLILDNPEGSEMYVDANAAPDWLEGNATPARLIIEASRETEAGQLHATLLSAAPEADVAAYDAKIAAADAKKRAQEEKRHPKKTKPKHQYIKNWSAKAQDALPYYAAFMMRRNKHLTKRQALKQASELIGFSLYYGVDARLIMAMVLVESGFNPNATSRKGAKGLGQLMPGTASGMGVTDAYDSEQNLYATVRIVRGHLEKYHKETDDPYEALVLALAAYNAGPGSVRRYDGPPPYKQTQNYIRNVIATYRHLAGK